LTNCRRQGATIKCKKEYCEKYFHGHICSLRSGTFQDDKYYCFNCVHENYADYFSHLRPREFHNDNYYIENDIYKTIERNWFNRKDQPAYDYIPQINDEIYYFWQGHEEFIQSHYLFFYNGKTCSTQRNKFPEFINYDIIRRHVKMQNGVNSPILCKIVSLKYEFPTLETMHLLEELEVQNAERIICVMKLKVLSQIQQNKSNYSEKQDFFTITYFKNDGAEFLILKDKYDVSKMLLSRHKQKLLGHTIKTLMGGSHKVQILNVKSFILGLNLVDFRI
jgi:hypothetical protein